MLRAAASKPTAVYTLGQSGVPMILPSSGSSNATGQITLTTALPYQPSGTCFIYLPLGVITAGSQGTAAGLYAVTFSSTTVCQLTGTGLTSANGAYTQTTAADLAVATITVPGGSMGANGRIRLASLWSLPNNANAKTLKTRLGGAAGSLFNSIALTASASLRVQNEIVNRGATNQQVGVNAGNAGFGSTTGGVFTASVDTSVDTTLVFQAQLAVATDYMILESYVVEVMP